MKVRVVVGAFAMLAGSWLAGSAAMAATPSFDCDGARTDVERMICDDDELAALDVELAKAFANALATAPASRVNNLKAQQVDWRRKMIGCGKASDPHGCTLQSYRARLSEL